MAERTEAPKATNLPDARRAPGSRRPIDGGRAPHTLEVPPNARLAARVCRAPSMPTLRPILPCPAAVRPTILALATAAATSVAHAQSATPTTTAARSSAGAVVLRGIVYDSLAHGPLVGATVQAVQVENAARARTASTDSTGAFQIDSLAPGRYLVGFLHPTLDLLSVQITPVVVVADGRPLPAVTLAVPGPHAVRAAVCPSTPPADSSGAIAGVVRNALTGDAAPGATVVLSWEELGVSRQGVQHEMRRVPVTARADGSFLVCGVPTDVALEASASAPGATSGLVEVTAPPRGLIVQRFALGPVATATTVTAEDSATVSARGGLARPAAGTARLVGRVVGPDSQAVRGARVQVWGTGARTATGPDGRYALGDLPAGTFTVEVKGIGLEPSRVPVDFANGQTAELPVTLAKAARQLERVSVVGKATERSRFLEEFERRRHTGQGQYYTAAEIEKSGATEVTDIIRSKAVPSLRVIPHGARGNVLRGRAGCVPNVWLDGSLIRNGANEIDDIVSAKAIEAIEVYGSGGVIPAQFNMTGTGGSLVGGPVSCGAVVIWTMR